MSQLTIIQICVLDSHVHTVLEVASVLLRQLAVVAHVMDWRASISRLQSGVASRILIGYVEASSMSAIRHLLHDALVRLVHASVVGFDELRLISLHLALSLPFFFLKLLRA